MPDNGQTGEQHIDVPVIRRKEGDLNTLLKAAEGSPINRISGKADDIRTLINELVTLMAVSEKEDMLRNRIEALTRERDLAVEELRQFNNGQKPEPEPEDEPEDDQSGRGVTTREERDLIRAWAAKKGRECAATGRMSEQLIRDYRSAMERAERFGKRS